MSLELIVNQQPGMLQWNFEELNEKLDLALQKYSGIIFNAGDMSEATRMRAQLNNVAKAINERKIQVKNEFCAPYFEFENNAKVLISKIKNVSEEISAQIKHYEEIEQRKKEEIIANWWQKNGLSDFSLEKLWDKKYLNKTCKEKDWQADLLAKKEKIEKDMAIIADMSEQSEREYVMADYYQTLDISKSLENLKKELECREIAKKRRAKTLAKQQNKGDFSHVEAQQPQGVQIYQKNENVALSQEKVAETEIYERMFKVTCTREQLIALSNFMNTNNIHFEKLN